MPVIAPFRGIRYNPKRVPDLNKVITQPYDKITPRMRDDYYQRSDHNFVRLIQNREENPYAASKATFERWLADDALMKSPQPSVYPYRQVFEVNGRRRVRRGLICLCKLEPFENGSILPHERTLSKPKEDRLNLMRTTAKQFEQVFMLYADDEDHVNKLLAPIWKWTPEVEVTDEYGTTHCLWSVSDPKTIHLIQTALRPRTFVIADGHHRYETALTYRDEMLKKVEHPTGKEAFNYRLVTCVNLNDPALVILPTHRLLASIPDFNLNDFLSRARVYFGITRIGADEIEKRLAASTRRGGRELRSFLLYAGPEKTYSFMLRPESGYENLFPPDRTADYRSLDVALLHSVLIERVLAIKPEMIENHVSYERDWKSAVGQVDNGTTQFAFLLHSTRPDQVRRIAENRERMPQKSTDFFPKMVSGLVCLDVDEKEQVT